MTTLTIMKQRIADEVARSDLTTMIAYAITDAIAHYQSKRFLFNESRDACTFDTVNTQEWYDKYDNKHIPNFMAIDYVQLDIDNNIFSLDRQEPEILDSIGTNVSAPGQPYSYTYYDRMIRLYPVPNEVWEVRVAGHIKLDAPATDAEANNEWMIDAERLIRNRAKLNLASHIVSSGLLPTIDVQALAIFKQEEIDALNELKGRTAKATGTGKIKPYGF